MANNTPTYNPDEWLPTEDIQLWSITYIVNGKVYTTREDYDHSWLCDIDIDDLVLVEEEE